MIGFMHLPPRASYRFDFFGAYVNADRALARQVEQQRLQFEATRRALATNIVIATINAATLSDTLEAMQRQTALAEQYAQQLASRAHLGSVSQDESWAAEQTAATLAAKPPPPAARMRASRSVWSRESSFSQVRPSAS